MCDDNDMNSISWEKRGSIRNPAWVGMERGKAKVMCRIEW